MRVAYLCADSGIPVFGNKGASNHVREFVSALAALGHEVVLFAARTGSGAGSLPCPIVEIPPGAADHSLPASFRSEAAALARNESLARALAAEPAFDFVYERYSLWSYAGFEFATAAGLPFALEVNSPLRLEQKKYRALHLDPAARAIELLLFRNASLVVGVSQEVIDYVMSESGRTLPAMALPNGVDLSLFERVADAAREDAFTIGFLGSLKPWHGVEVLLEAFRSLDGDGRLLVVGEGPMREWVERYGCEHGLEDRIELTGGVDKARVPALLARMDVAVAPYPALDGFYFSPLKLFEYMAAGRAIVASEIGQIAGIVRHGETALLVKPGDAAELAGALATLRANAPLRRRLGANARQAAIREHGWKSRVETVLAALGKEAFANVQ